MYICLFLDAEAADPNIMYVIEANNRFAFDLYKALAKGDQDNIAFSPLSISAALSQVMLGARGDTANTLRKALYLKHAEKDWIHPSYSTLLQSLQVSHGPRNVLHMANRLFLEDDYSFLLKFKDDSDVFYAKPELLDFRDAEVARRQINKVIERETKVRNLVHSDDLDDDALLVLASGAYFRRTWLNMFEEEHTREFQFRKTPDDAFSAEIMIGRGMFRGIYDTQLAARLIELPFSDNKRKMVVVMPSGVEAGALEKVDEKLDYDDLKELQEDITGEKPYDILLPKMKLGHSLNMKEALSSLGLGELFQANKPDLSGMSTKDLHIRSFMHRVSLDFTEEGIKRTDPTELPPDRDRAVMLRPFMFYIQDVYTGAIVMMGRVRNPTIVPFDHDSTYNTRDDDTSDEVHHRHDELWGPL